MPQAIPFIMLAMAAASTIKSFTDKKPGAPQPAGQAPTTPDKNAAAQQGMLDEQKRQALMGPSTTTNEGGAQGLLTSDATYAKKTLTGA
jgi:hypothetical protein